MALTPSILCCAMFGDNTYTKRIGAFQMISITEQIVDQESYKLYIASYSYTYRKTSIRKPVTHIRPRYVVEGINKNSSQCSSIPSISASFIRLDSEQA
jgi:hypothetical protein